MTTSPVGREAELISLPAACRIVGIAQQTALKASQTGEFPPVTRVGRTRYLSRRALEQWLAERCGPRTAA